MWVQDITTVPVISVMVPGVICWVGGLRLLNCCGPQQQGHCIGGVVNWLKMIILFIRPTFLYLPTYFAGCGGVLIHLSLLASAIESQGCNG